MRIGRKQQVICLDVRGSAVYERAFLILRSGAGEDDEELLLREADRLVSRAVERRGRSTGGRRGRDERTEEGTERSGALRRSGRPFLAGCCVGAAGALLLLGVLGGLRFLFAGC